ncbi:MAG: RNA 2',3'-cyclic phosphodiesterase [bacterium]
MKKRIFIAINLSEDLRKKLLIFRDKWEFLPVRWTKKDSLHLTLVFIGYVDEEEIYEACRLARGVAARHEAFDIGFERILYGPPALRQAQGKAPRMIWLEGKANEKLSKLKLELDDVLASSESLRSFRPERRPFSPHITLARMNMDKWRDLSEQPAIEQELKAIVPVASIEVMESDLRCDGAEYTILESCPLEG